VEDVTVVVIADWIKRVAEDERKRDAARLAEREEIARKAELVRLHGQRLVNELRAAVARDVESFCHEFSADQSRNIVLDAGNDGALVVTNPSSPPTSLTVEPRLEMGTVNCHYQFTSAGGLPPREDRFDLVFAGDGGGRLQMKHQGTWRVFETSDALSEFLLVPVLTGRPR
jgi:hypothetical protein